MRKKNFRRPFSRKKIWRGYREKKNKFIFEFSSAPQIINGIIDPLLGTNFTHRVLFIGVIMKRRTRKTTSTNLIRPCYRHWPMYYLRLAMYGKLCWNHILSLSTLSRLKSGIEIGQITPYSRLAGPKKEAY